MSDQQVTKIVDYLLCTPDEDMTLSSFIDLTGGLWGSDMALYYFDEAMSRKLDLKLCGFIPIAFLDRDESTVEFLPIADSVPHIFKAINDACAECGWWYETSTEEISVPEPKNLDITEESIAS
jgi:hypothetical protein